MFVCSYVGMMVWRSGPIVPRGGGAGGVASAVATRRSSIDAIDAIDGEGRTLEVWVITSDAGGDISGARDSIGDMVAKDDTKLCVDNNCFAHQYHILSGAWLGRNYASIVLLHYCMVSCTMCIALPALPTSLLVY